MDRAFVLSEETFKHQYRVATLTTEFAQHLGAKDALISILFASSQNHDIGKAAVDETLLKKPFKLTEDEFEAVKSHAPEGAKILKEMNVNQEVIEAVLCHHESFDGTGYPNKLKGEEIPLSARILKICDVYDALTSKRCYRPRAYTNEEALEIMEKMKNEFDPYLYKEFTLFIKKLESQTA